MSGLASLFTSVFVGWMLAATNFAPVIGWHRFLENRRRVYNAVFLFAGSFILILAAVLLATIDVVVQFEDQGLLFWNPILTTAAVIGAFGIMAFAAAQVCMPKPKDYLVFDGNTVLDRLNTLFTQPAPPPPVKKPRPAAEPVMTEFEPEPETTTFRPTPTPTPGSAYAH